MSSVAVRNRILIGAVFVVVAAVIGYQMFFSMTPPRHADHDHAMATIDAGGFLWVDRLEGGRRNLVGRPGKVLVMHWFDPTAVDTSEQAQAARFTANKRDDPMVDVIFVARAPSREAVEAWAESVGVSSDRLYLDPDGRTADLIGVRRLPETLIYDSDGRLAYQARGRTDWGAGMAARIETAKAGVEEID